MKVKFGNVFSALILASASLDAISRPTVDISALDPEDGFVLAGTIADAQLGAKLAGIGDFNGDGLDDFAVATHGAVFTSTYSKIFIVHGRSSWPQAISDITNSTNMTMQFDELGTTLETIAGIGDFDGDSRADFAIQYSNYDQQDYGYRVYMIRSRVSSNGVLHVGQPDGQNIVGLHRSSPISNLGSAIEGGQDINGDERADFVVGASGESRAFVIYGRDPDSDNNYPADSDAANFANITLEKEANEASQSVFNRFGYSMALADTNNDGKSDLLLASNLFVGNYPGDSNGGAYLIKNLGSMSGVVSLDQIEGLARYYAPASPWPVAGSAVAAVPDLLGPGKAGLLISRGTTQSEYSGGWLLRPSTGNVPLGGIAPPDGQYITTNTFNSDGPGQNILSVGDVNGDKINDWLLSQSQWNNPSTGTGRCAVIYGTSPGMPANVVDISSLGLEAGFTIEDRADTLACRTVSALGDINGDGLADIGIAQYWVDGLNGQHSGGRVTVVFGSDRIIRSGFDTETP